MQLYSRGRGGEGGFTLIEVIVTIIAAGILGVIFINFMGTAMSKSARAVLNVEAEADAQRLMERIISDYAIEINKADPAGALETIRNRDYLTQFPGSRITRRYITFDSTGNPTVLPPETTNGDTLRITVQWDIDDVTNPGGTAITTLLTRSRIAGDPAVAF